MWTEECQSAFNDLIEALLRTPVLQPPDFTKPFKVQTDASEFGLGAMLAQQTDGEEDMVAYAS